MRWIKEVEIEKSIHDLMTSQSITGRRDFHDDAIDCVCIEEAFSRMCTSEGEQVSKSNVLRNTTDSFEEGRLLTCSTENFRATGAYEAILRYADTFKKKAYRMMMFKFSTKDGTKLYKQQVKYQRKWSWKVYTSQNYRILFSFRLCWLCMTKRLPETMGNRATPD